MRGKRGRRSAKRLSSYQVRVFKNGGSQAIRIPRALRVDSEEVTIRRVGETLVVEPVHLEWGEAFSKAFLQGNNARVEFPGRRQPDWRNWKAGR